MLCSCCSARDAVRLLADVGLHVEMEGSGLVENQVPEAGATIPAGGRVQLALREGLEPARRAVQ